MGGVIAVAATIQAAASSPGAVAQEVCTQAVSDPVPADQLDRRKSQEATTGVTAAPR